MYSRLLYKNHVIRKRLFTNTLIYHNKTGRNLRKLSHISLNSFMPAQHPKQKSYDRLPAAFHVAIQLSSAVSSLLRPWFQ